MEIDLDSIERDIASFEAAKGAATPGDWYQGAWYGRCMKHADQGHPGSDHPTDPCQVTFVLTTDGENVRFVSTEDHALLVGADQEGPFLSEGDARFIVLAKNTPIEDHARQLLEEVRRLRAIVGRR